jgi:hypothetical protein
MPEKSPLGHGPFVGRETKQRKQKAIGVGPI